MRSSIVRSLSLLVLAAALPACGGGGGAAIHAIPDFHDPLFGPGGSVPLRSLTDATVAAVVIQPDGKPVVAGSSIDPASGFSEFFVARFTAGGAPDDTFYEGGLRTIPFSGVNAKACGVALQPDGMIVVAGHTPSGYTIYRLKSDGDIDFTLNGGGGAFISISGSDNAAGVAIQADGKIVVAGTSNNDFAVVRFNSDGSPDLTFDSDGKVTTPIGAGLDLATGVAIQPDGKIVVAGSSNNGTDLDFAMVRYLPTGALDTTFDGDGKVTTAGTDFCSSLALRPNGKIVAAGSASGDVMIVQYNADGSLDAGFGSSGIVTTPVGTGGDAANAITLQPDGRLVAACGAINGGGLTDFALVRYNTDGTLDATFGTGGRRLDPSGTGVSVNPTAVAVQPGGRILAGATRTTGSGTLATLVACLPAGAPDPDFRLVGGITFSIGGLNQDPRCIALQSTGKIIVALNSFAPGAVSSDVVVVRLKGDGSVDPTFGTDGISTVSFSSKYDNATRIALQTDDKIVLSGYVYDDSTLSYTGRVARLTADGVLDSSFGTGGIVTVAPPGRCTLSAVAVQSDGKIVVGGYAGTPTVNFFLTRLLTDGTVDPGFGSVTTPISADTNFIRDILIQPDGKILAMGDFYAPPSAGTAVVRYTSAGALDATFGTGGQALFTVGSTTTSFYSFGRLLLRPDGRIVFGQFLFIADPSQLTIRQLMPDGTLDPSFGSGGSTTIPFPTLTNPWDTALLADGRVIFGEGGAAGQALYAFGPGGGLDSSFAAGGRMPVACIPGEYEADYAVLVQPDGKILVLGFTEINLNQICSVSRYVP